MRASTQDAHVSRVEPGVAAHAWHQHLADGTDGYLKLSRQPVRSMTFRFSERPCFKRNKKWRVTEADTLATHVHMLAHTCTWAHAHTSSYMHHTHTRVYIHTLVYTCAIHIHAHEHMHVLSHIYTKDTCICAYTTHMPTQAHIYTTHIH